MNDDTIHKAISKAPIDPHRKSPVELARGVMMKQDEIKKIQSEINRDKEVLCEKLIEDGAVHCLTVNMAKVFRTYGK